MSGSFVISVVFSSLAGYRVCILVLLFCSGDSCFAVWMVVVVHVLPFGFASRSHYSGLRCCIIRIQVTLYGVCAFPRVLVVG